MGGEGPWKEDRREIRADASNLLLPAPLSLTGQIVIELRITRDGVTYRFPRRLRKLLDPYSLQNSWRAGVLALKITDGACESEWGSL